MDLMLSAAQAAGTAEARGRRMVPSGCCNGFCQTAWDICTVDGEISGADAGDGNGLSEKDACLEDHGGHARNYIGDCCASAEEKPIRDNFCPMAIENMAGTGGAPMKAHAASFPVSMSCN